MKNINTEITCPTCKGHGYFTISISFPETKNLKEKVKSLHKQGFSLRQIGTKLGIKNAGTVHYYLNKKTK